MGGGDGGFAIRHTFEGLDNENEMSSKVFMLRLLRRYSPYFKSFAPPEDFRIRASDGQSCPE